MQRGGGAQALPSALPSPFRTAISSSRCGREPCLSALPPGARAGFQLVLLGTEKRFSFGARVSPGSLPLSERPGVLSEDAGRRPGFPCGASELPARPAGSHPAGCARAPVQQI